MVSGGATVACDERPRLGAWVRIPKLHISKAHVVYPGDPDLTMLWSGHLQSDFGPTLLGSLPSLLGARIGSEGTLGTDEVKA